nr:hypothetical protein [Sulfurirhabdus autotrophica]
MSNGILPTLNPPETLAEAFEIPKAGATVFLPFGWIPIACSYLEKGPPYVYVDLDCKFGRLRLCWIEQLYHHPYELQDVHLYIVNPWLVFG